jgi:hypothetical protein
MPGVGASHFSIAQRKDCLLESIYSSFSSSLYAVAL